MLSDARKIIRISSVIPGGAEDVLDGFGMLVATDGFGMLVVGELAVSVTTAVDVLSVSGDDGGVNVKEADHGDETKTDGDASG
ncbi:unnamed protein product [Phytophthora fragariaefolia]|uniref:Unnamed protein product n=1 Tax=Phytophthora fragariaefolia TaxID=1490495 RepID=A0A9W7D9P4_9STRA|nr:unnamed protein product [Phytophthora fragariaefolia]